MQERKTYRGTYGQILMPNDAASPMAGPRPSIGREQRIAGVNGFMKWGYFTAAEVRSYTVIRDMQGRWSLTCYVVNPDAYKMSQKPLRFVAPHEKGEWRWVIESIEVRDSVCTAKLSQPLP